MTKLTTERLEKFVNDIKTDGMCDITDHQVESALIQLLAFEQAAKNPVAWTSQRALDTKCKIVAFTDKDSAKEYGEKHGWEVISPVFLSAPVLPKQPELVVLTDEQIDAVLDSNANMAYIISDKRERLRMFAREIIRTAMISTAPAQPVIPEHANLMKHSSVIAEQLEHVISGMDVTDHQRAVISCAIDRLNKNADILQQKPTAIIAPEKLDYQSAKELFNYLMNEEETNATVNGWNACRSEMLKAQPVSEPHKLPDGWVMVPEEATMDMLKAGAKQDMKGEAFQYVWSAMLAAAPAQESE